jgi:hypothetical protein
MADDTLVREQTPLEYFKEQLEKAMEHQRVATSTFTEHYLVTLLAACVRGGPPPGVEGGFEDAPLALLYVRAVHAARHERARLLRAMGDTALFVSGFFADSLSGKLASLDYYRTMGGHAYACLSRQDELLAFGPEVFSELSDRFTQFADLLSEVSEASRLTSSSSVLKLYERWIQTGSPRAATLLAERGLVPVQPGELKLQ